MKICRICGRLTAEAVFGPRISGVAIAAHFPEAEFVLGGEFDLADEFRAFPGVELRNDDAGRAAVFAGERFAFVSRGDEDVVVHDVVEPDVRGVAVVAGEEDVFHFRLRSDQFGKREKCNAGPLDIELAPGGDAVEIDRVFEGRERVEFLPGEVFECSTRPPISSRQSPNLRFQDECRDRGRGNRE